VGTLVLPRTSRTGTEWLAGIVATADPASRDAEPEAGEDAGLPLGAVDAAYDARGKRVADIKHYLAERFGMPPGDTELIGRLLRRKPPACIVIVGVDRAEPRDDFLREVVLPLAAGARLRGMRLVLGFDDRAPSWLPRDVSIDPRPITSDSPGSAGEAEEHVGQLGAAEDDAALMDRGDEIRFIDRPKLPPARAPRLRVRLAVARAVEAKGASPNPEVAAIDEAAATALGKVESFLRHSRRTGDELHGLRTTFDLCQNYADKHWASEDQPFGDLRDETTRALQQAPIDIARARDLVRRYQAEIYRDIKARHSGGDGEEDRG
jgi:hypothetical protein